MTEFEEKLVSKMIFYKGHPNTVTSGWIYWDISEDSPLSEEEIEKIKNSEKLQLIWIYSSLLERKVRGVKLRITPEP